MLSILVLIFLALISRPGLTQENGDELMRVADLTPGGKALYRRTLHQELTDVMDLIETHYVDPLERKSLMQSCVEGVGTPWSDGEKVEKVFHRFIYSFDELNPDSARQQMLKCIDSTLKQLGPQNRYFDSDKMQKLIADAKTKTGIDITLIRSNDRYEVVDVGEDGPAQLAGLQTGDVIVSIGGVSLATLKTEQIEELIHGKTGSVVTFEVFRPSLEKPFEIIVTRVPTDPGKIESKLLTNKVAHLTLRQFTSSTLRWFTASFQELLVSANGPIRGVMLDLRACTGGLLPVSVGLSAAFLPEKSPVVEIKGRTKDLNLSLRAEKSYYVQGKEPDPLAGLSEDIKTIPLVVVTGSRTSGGCEIIAAALQDNQRATIVGSQTAKQGLISQYFRPLNFLSPRLRLTTSRIIRSNGRSLAETGVNPDVSVESKLQIDLAGPGPVLDRAVQEIEARIK